MTPETTGIVGEFFIEVPFHDVDSVHIVWHGHYVKYFEMARCALLERYNYNYDDMVHSGYVWPIIDLHLRYVKPAHFKQKLRVVTRLKEWQHRLKFDYLIYDADTGERMTRGSSVQVAVAADTGIMQLVSPDVLLERLGLAR